jgi:hypothetical protein
MDLEGIVEAAFEAVSVQPVRALAENQNPDSPAMIRARDHFALLEA